jgi:hypothetical protein
MVVRTCPNLECGEENYSSDDLNAWKCCTCGAVIPVPEVEEVAK